MSIAVLSTGSMMFDYVDFFKTSSANVKVKDAAVVAAAATMASQHMLGALASGQGHISSTSSGTNGASNITSNASLRRSYNNLVNLIEQHRKLDRTVSEPTSRYKTELCRPFEESGSCKYGDKCQFAHGYNELRNLARHPKYKTELCRTFHKIGFCPYGPRCHFVHNFEEARIQNLKLAAAVSAIGGTATTSVSSLGFSQVPQPLSMNMTLLEQLSSSPAQPRGSCGTIGGPLARANLLNLTSPSASHQRHQQYQLQQQQQLHAPLHRSSSLVLSEAHTTKPTPLNLSPTLSLGSAADSISPSSSLSQSPTNSMSSFFNDEPASKNFGATGLQTTGPPFITGFGQELADLLRCSPSPPILSSRTQSPLSPGAESRLPVFNQISSTVFDNFENLKI